MSVLPLHVSIAPVLRPAALTAGVRSVGRRWSAALEHAESGLLIASSAAGAVGVALAATGLLLIH